MPHSACHPGRWAIPERRQEQSHVRLHHTTNHDIFAKALDGSTVVSDPSQVIVEPAQQQRLCSRNAQCECQAGARPRPKVRLMRKRRHVNDRPNAHATGTHLWLQFQEVCHRFAISLQLGNLGVGLEADVLCHLRCEPTEQREAGLLFAHLFDGSGLVPWLAPWRTCFLTSCHRMPSTRISCSSEHPHAGHEQCSATTTLRKVARDVPSAEPHNRQCLQRGSSPLCTPQPEPHRAPSWRCRDAPTRSELCLS